MANVVMIHQSMLLQERYRVVRRLGKGGFGQAYEVDDRGTPKVLKVLTLERFQSREGKHKAVSLFKREAAVLSRLQHPGIPRVEPDGYFTWSEGTDEPMHCLVMEKIEGLNLKQWMENQGNQPLSQDLAIAWLKQLTEILDKVHQEELVHRDLKPSNIMLRPNGQLVLIDFGAVREVTETYLSRQKENLTGTVIISAGYTPPEQAEGKAVPQSDFFALGRTFVYLLTAKNPTDFDKDPRTGKLNWRECAPQASKELGNVIDYLMATFPGRRPQTSTMIMRCLEEIAAPVEPQPVPMPLRDVKRSSSPVAVTSGGNSTGIRKQKAFLGFLSHLLPTTVPPNPWHKAKLRRTLSGHSDVVKSVAISPDGVILASGSYDKTIKLWSLRNGELLRTLTGHTHRVTCIAISPDGQILASGSYDRTIKLWSLETCELLHTLTGHSDRIRDIAFSPNGQMLVSSAIQVKLWAVRTGKLVRNLTEQSTSARLVAFSPDSQTCVLGSLDGTIEVWNPHNGKLLRTFSTQAGGITASGIGSVAFSPDGQTLASGKGMAIQLWNPNTGKLLNSFSCQSNGCAYIAFSPDGYTLASGTGKLIELWNLHTGKRLGVLSGHLKSVESVAFSPDGYILVSGGEDQTIKIWQPM